MMANLSVKKVLLPVQTKFSCVISSTVVCKINAIHCIIMLVSKRSYDGSNTTKQWTCTSL